MTAVGLVLFLVGLFFLRMFGGFVLGGLIGDSDFWKRLLNLLPLSLVSAVVATQVFITSGSLVIDARVVGIGVAIALSLRRAPLAVVVIGAAAATAGTRALGWG
ncbi:MAG: AzlD domain-containing protein [Acidimicrobiales bacterium]